MLMLCGKNGALEETDDWYCICRQILIARYILGSSQHAKHSLGRMKRHTQPFGLNDLSCPPSPSFVAYEAYLGRWHRQARKPRDCARSGGNSHRGPNVTPCDTTGTTAGKQSTYIISPIQFYLFPTSILYPRLRDCQYPFIFV